MRRPVPFFLSRLAAGALGVSVLAGVVASAPVGAEVTPSADVSVLLRAGAAPLADAPALVRSVGGELGPALPIVDGVVAEVPAHRVADLAAAGLVVDENAPVSLASNLYGENGGNGSAVYPAVTGATRVWDQGVTGAGVTVAVVDTGIDTRTDLAGKVVGGFDFSGEGDYTRDSYGHGTFVAGVVAGTGAASGGAVRGEAPGVDLVSLKVAGADGSSDLVRVLGAIQWAVVHRDVHNIRVLNLSLGLPSDQDWRIDPLNAAVERAWQSGIVVTVAAGNLGPTSGTITKPGDDPYVITTGATDDVTTVATGDDYVPPFSSVGPTRAGVAKPDLVAPGARLVSLRVPGSTIDTRHPAARVESAYFRGSGTSFSSAVTAGAAALVLQQHPTLVPDQVKARLLASADPAPGTAAQVGHGLLDAHEAVNGGDRGRANQGLPLAQPSGSLQRSRGALCVRAAADQPCLTDAEARTVVPFDPATYWQANSWQANSWQANSWQANSWQANTWQANSWQANSWQANSWQANSWQANSWQANSWQANTWQDAVWWSSSWQ